MEPEMYINDESNENPISRPRNALLTRKGKTHLITLGDKHFEVVDPQLVMQIERIMHQLEHRISVLENELQQTKAKLNRADKKINLTARELQNKVDYE